MYAPSDANAMKAWVALLAAAAAMPLLAGCSGPVEEAPPPLTASVTGSELENGTFYAFAHGGGDLAFSVAANGSADVVLYGADDQRIGHIGVGAEQARGRFVVEGVAAGDLVLHALSVNGTLDVRSRGTLVESFRALPLHVERHLLLEREGGLLPVPLVPNDGETVDEVVEVSLLRAPAVVTLLAKATYESLAITVKGRSGTLYEVQAGGSPFSTPQAFFGPLPGEARPENVRDGEVSVGIQASGFRGLLVLEAQSFSRAEAVAGDVRPSSDVPRFTYGELPDQPVSFEVRAGTERLYLWQEGAGAGCGDEAEADGPECQPGQPSHVALFGPDDERIATVSVPANGTVAVAAATPGVWVAVLLDGQATLGADRVPGDFELHPLETQETTAPAEAAGGDDGSYGVGRQGIDAGGVPFRVAPAAVNGVGTSALPNDPMSGGFIVGCDPSSAAVLLRGETIGAWGFGTGRVAEPDLTPIDPALLLGDGELEVAYDDFGRGCDRTGVLVTSYVR
jgi:hypothetical protein